MVMQDWQGAARICGRIGLVAGAVLIQAGCATPSPQNFTSEQQATNAVNAGTSGTITAEKSYFGQSGAHYQLHVTCSIPRGRSTVLREASAYIDGKNVNIPNDPVSPRDAAVECWMLGSWLVDGRKGRSYYDVRFAPELPKAGNTAAIIAAAPGL